ncbi:hypothetical protein V493_08521 [Pseudogymnoascus sp. VKM F-4281 (FW-2241)]|nr:hypothetical protein V493_08521 [Pseudogymnoascus sp. VKM F-4281 (FW-2241)]
MYYVNHVKPMANAEEAEEAGERARNEGNGRKMDGEGSAIRRAEGRNAKCIAEAGTVQYIIGTILSPVPLKYSAGLTHAHAHAHAVQRSYGLIVRRERRQRRQRRQRRWRWETVSRH